MTQKQFDIIALAVIELGLLGVLYIIGEIFHAVGAI